MLADSNVPNIYWDFVTEHAVLVNSMITPSISDKTKTIFEAVWDVILNIDLIPPITVSRVNAYSGGVLARALPESLRYLST